MRAYLNDVVSTDRRNPTVIRLVPGDNPPATALAEIYELPFGNRSSPNLEAPLELPEYLYHAGIDWANASYAVSIIDATRKQVAEFSVPHSGQGIAELIDRVSKLVDGEPAALSCDDSVSGHLPLRARRVSA